VKVLARLTRLPADDLWRDPGYLRLWSSILTASFAYQVMMLALPLTAAVLLQDPGQLARFGGWLGEHVGLRATLAFAGATSLVLAVLAWRLPLIRGLRRLPGPEPPADWVEFETDARPT
jgi:hypothetical protein